MEVIGESGELVELLVEAVNSDNWLELAWFLAFAIGGEPMRVEPDTGRDYPPGSVGAELRRTRQTVSRDMYFTIIRNRLRECVEFGIREDVLVYGLRDEITRQLKSFANSEQGNERRAKMKANLEHSAADSDFIAQFRKNMARQDPSVASMTDQQISDILLSMAERMAPIPIERELELWTSVDRWVSRTKEMISDVIIDEWFEKFAERASR